MHVYCTRRVYARSTSVVHTNRTQLDLCVYAIVQTTDMTTAASSVYAPCTAYYGAVLPKRRPHHVLILSVCLSCLSVPCLHLEEKRKGLRIPNLVGRVPGLPAPRGPISKSRGQRSRSRRLIALLVKLCYQYGMIIDYVARTYSTARTVP